jgi:hypothetical protein
VSTSDPNEHSVIDKPEPERFKAALDEVQKAKNRLC